MAKFTHPFMHLLVLALWALAMMVVSVIAGMALGIADDSEFGSPNAGFLLWNVFVQLMTFALPVLLLARRYYREEQREFYRLDFGRKSWMLAGLGVVVLLLLVPLTDWLATWNDSWHFPGAWGKLEHSLREAGNQSQQMVESFLKECPPLLNLFGLALIPALCEELFFRAGVQNLLQRWFKNPHAAVWVTAALFSLAHGELFAFLPRFLLGALLGYLYVYGRSLLVNVLAHFANNAIVVVTYALMSGDSTSFDPSAPLALSPLLTLACTLAAVALLVVVFGKTRNASSSNK
jgi:hypothetical protein